mmetsp:Transcript_21103/g.63494  ORF Transcript_21103/g.63494 Transcript_21103/m.63494 type:complete len:219 (+) Transcript_21103:457-1113(+)
MLASPPDVSATEVSAPAAVDTSLGNPPLVGMSGPPERSQSASPEVAPANPPWMRGGEAVKVPIEDSSATGCSSAPTARRATAKDTERLLPGLRPALPGVASLPIPPDASMPPNMGGVVMAAAVERDAKASDSLSSSLARAIARPGVRLVPCSNQAWKYRTTWACCSLDRVATSRMRREKAVAEVASSRMHFTAYCRPSSLLMASSTAPNAPFPRSRTS